MEHVNSVHLVGEICSQAKIGFTQSVKPRRMITVDIAVTRKTLTDNGTFKVSSKKQVFTIRILDKIAGDMRPYLSLYEEGRTVELKGELVEVNQGGQRLATVLIEQPSHYFEARLSNAELLNLQEEAYSFTSEDLLKEIVEQPVEPNVQQAYEETDTFNHHYEPTDDEMNSYHDSLASSDVAPPEQCPEFIPETKNQESVQCRDETQTNKVRDHFIAQSHKKELQQLQTGTVVEGTVYSSSNQEIQIREPSTSKKELMKHSNSPLASGYNVNSFVS